jgi:hypothetical protein
MSTLSSTSTSSEATTGHASGVIVACFIGIALGLVLAFAAAMWVVKWRRTRREGYKSTLDAANLTAFPSLSRSLQQPTNTTNTNVSPSPPTESGTRSRPALQLVTRRGTVASLLSTRVVVEHEADGGHWEESQPHNRDPEALLISVQYRNKSLRDEEGRRIVRKLIPPAYDSSWAPECKEGQEGPDAVGSGSGSRAGPASRSASASAFGSGSTSRPTAHSRRSSADSEGHDDNHVGEPESMETLASPTYIP